MLEKNNHTILNARYEKWYWGQFDLESCVNFSSWKYRNGPIQTIYQLISFMLALDFARDSKSLNYICNAT